MKFKALLSLILSISIIFGSMSVAVFAAEKSVETNSVTKETRTDENHYHTWGDYIYNNDAANDIDGTKTAHCTKEGCTATDTVIDREHLRLNAIPLKKDMILEKGKLYTISDFEEWKIFSKVCEQDTTGISFALTKEIKMNNRNYRMKPIEKFSGNFDGMGCSLRGIIISSEMFDLAGVFSLCDGAEIKNIKLLGTSVFDSNADGEATAALCAKAVNSKFTDCTIDCGPGGTNNYIGGLIGYAENCEIIGCRNLTMIVGIDDNYVGGLIGYAKNCILKECYNKGKVYGGIAGGLVGCMDNCEVEYCYNIGDVDNVDGETYLGGFAGIIYPSQKENSIRYCYTSGNVYSKNSGKFCGFYAPTNIFAMESCMYIGNDISQADANGVIDSAYKHYLDTLTPDDDYYHTCVFTGKSLGIFPVEEINLKSFNSDKFVGDADNSNNGYIQLRRFHTEHVWGEYGLKDGKMIAECLCEGCEYTTEKAIISYVTKNIQGNGYKLGVTGSPDKIQFISSNGSTRTYNRNNSLVTVTKESDTDYETWNIVVNLPVDDYSIIVKYGKNWSKACYDFKAKDNVDCRFLSANVTGDKSEKIIIVQTGIDVIKIQLSEPERNYCATIDYGYDDSTGIRVWTFKRAFALGSHDMDILIKTKDGWTDGGKVQFESVR